MATFEIDGKRGTFDGTNWTIDVPFLRDELLPSFAALYEPDGYDPDRTNSVLRFVMDLAGGTVVDADPPESIEDEPGRVYEKVKIEGEGGR